MHQPLDIQRPGLVPAHCLLYRLQRHEPFSFGEIRLYALDETNKDCILAAHFKKLLAFHGKLGDLVRCADCSGCTAEGESADSETFEKRVVTAAVPVPVSRHYLLSVVVPEYRRRKAQAALTGFEMVGMRRVS
jgi:hypothetical protein